MLLHKGYNHYHTFYCHRLSAFRFQSHRKGQRCVTGKLLSLRTKHGVRGISQVQCMLTSNWSGFLGGQNSSRDTSNERDGRKEEEGKKSGSRLLWFEFDWRMPEGNHVTVRNWLEVGAVKIVGRRRVLGISHTTESRQRCMMLDLFVTGYSNLRT